MTTQHDTEKELFKILSAKHASRMRARLAARRWLPDGNHPMEARPEYQYLGNGNYQRRVPPLRDVFES